MHNSEFLILCVTCDCSSIHTLIYFILILFQIVQIIVCSSLILCFLRLTFYCIGHHLQPHYNECGPRTSYPAWYKRPLGFLPNADDNRWDNGVPLPTRRRVRNCRPYGCRQACPHGRHNSRHWLINYLVSWTSFVLLVGLITDSAIQPM